MKTLLPVQRALLSAMAACVLAPGAPGAQGGVLPPAGEAVAIFEPFVPRGETNTRSFPGALASHPVHVRLDRIQALAAGRRLLLPLSASEQWQGTVQRVERREGGACSLFGTLEDSPGAWFIITIEAGGLMATFQIPERNLSADLRNLAGDDYALCAFDARRAGRFDCGVGQTPPGNRTRSEGEVVESQPYPLQATIATPAPQHDVLVVYTQGVVNDFPNHFPNTPLDTGVQHLVDFSNQCYANSGVPLHMRLAYRGLVDPTFSETGHDRDWLLNRLSGTADGIIDNIHSLRANFHADIVCMLYSYDTQAYVPPGTFRGGGLANLLDPTTFGTANPGNWYSSAFCVVEALWEPSSYDPPLGGMALTEFAHEIGHTQGLGHDCEDNPGTPVTSYAYGWRFTGSSGTKYVDIMSYLTGIYATATPIPYFGNASIYFDGQPTGSNAPGCGFTTAPEPRPHSA